MPEELDAWWKSKRILSEIALNICGDPNADAMGIPKFFKTTFKNKLPFKRGVSVGCGSSGKDCNLVKHGIVELFEITEINAKWYEFASQHIKDQHLDDKVHIYQEDAFELFSAPNQFDFVYWDSSLHHMPSVRHALEWSRHVLKDGGVIFVYEFVGPTRNRQTGTRLEIINYIRSLLTGQSSNLTTELMEIKPETAEDPTEMWDCDNIIPGLSEVFPNVNISYIGGFIYQSVLWGLFSRDFEDSPMMNVLLLLDNAYAQLGLSDYIIAYATKEPSNEISHIVSRNTADNRSDVITGDIKMLLKEKNTCLENLKMTIKKREVYNILDIKNLNATICNQEIHIKNLEGIIKDKEAHIRNLEAHAGNLENIIKDKEALINAMRATKGWRVLEKLRRIKNRFYKK